MARTPTSTLTVPLRAAWAVPRYQRAPRALTEIRKQVARHLKVTDKETIWIDNAVNEAVWARGIEKPPRRIKLKISRHEGEDIPISVELAEE